MEIRLLEANEIECRVQSMKKDNTGASFLLYKDARCDMKRLDELFGPFGWERDHVSINGKLFCNLRIWDEAHGRWVTKQDVGTESNTEAVKGEASDSFKRACINVGIGRELYTGPFIWINFNADDFNQTTNKLKTVFSVKEVGYNEHREINYLVIQDHKGNVRYTFGRPQAQQHHNNSTTTPQQEPQAQEPTPQAAEQEIIYKCFDCGADTDAKMATRSNEKLGRIVCRTCGEKIAAQDKVKAAAKEAAKTKAAAAKEAKEAKEQVAAGKGGKK